MKYVLKHFQTARQKFHHIFVQVFGNLFQDLITGQETLLLSVFVFG